MASRHVDLRIPISVRNFTDRPVQALPYWTGVPLPRSTVAEAGDLRLLGPDGSAVPAQFDVLARWSDGSVKWVLVSFFAQAPPGARPEPLILTADAALPVPQVPSPATAHPDTHRFKVSTGVLDFVLNRHGFAGPAVVRLDCDGDGVFGADDLIAPGGESAGIVAVDADGVEYTSRLGRLGEIEVERAGPVHVVVAVRGDLRAASSDRALLNYTMRIHAFAGSSLLRVVLTIHNPRPSGRADDGSRWVLGQSGACLLKSLDFLRPVRLPEGHRRATLSPEPGKLLDRIPLGGLAPAADAAGAHPAVLSVYQDSSGGANWFHRTHVNRDNLIPLRFRGYRVGYRGSRIDSGLRASPWIEVADMRWAAAVAVPNFWQNFPKALAVEADGALRVSLWPAESADLHEIQGGEQKTHEFWVYFRHRLGEGAAAERMPLASEVMPACLQRPAAWASAEAYTAAGVIDPYPPLGRGKFDKYEAVVSAAVRGEENLFTHRERADEFGWRHFGDTPAFNERDKTQGPYHGQPVVSHYNNEYDLGFGMLEQALRCADADAELARAWWDLALAALWHEADIDIYHTGDDPAPIYNGGTFTHTSHGVDAGRSTHRGSPRDEMWGRLDWPWHRGSTPEAGHLRNRGILLAYYLTGDRHLLDAAWELVELVAFKIRTDQFAQIQVPDRSGGNNLQILLEAYLHTQDRRYLDLCEQVVASLDYDAVAERSGRPKEPSTWSSALYVKSLMRFIETLAEQGVRHEKAIRSHLRYARDILAYSRSLPSGHFEGPWSYLISEVMTQAAELTADPAERREFLAAAKAAFHALDATVGADGRGRFITSKSTTMHLQGGGRYMLGVLAGRTGKTAKKATRKKARTPAGRRKS